MAGFSSNEANPFLRKQFVDWRLFYDTLGVRGKWDGLVFPEHDDNFNILIVSPGDMTRVETLKKVCIGLSNFQYSTESLKGLSKDEVEFCKSFQEYLRNLVGFNPDELAERYPSEDVRKPLWAHKEQDSGGAEKTSTMTWAEAGLLSFKYLFNRDVCVFNDPPNSILCGGSKDMRGFRPFFFTKKTTGAGKTPVLCVSHLEPGPANSRALWRVKRG